MINSDKRSRRRSSSKKLRFLSIQELVPSERNARKHGRAQITAIAKSISAFGFNAPIIVTQNGTILAGHGRFEAAKLLKLQQVPVITVDHLTDAQASAYMLADNKLTDRSTWDDIKVATQLKELADLALDFDIEAIGFELPEIDFRIQSLDQPEERSSADEFDIQTGIPTCQTGELWVLGDHRLYCGSALDTETFSILFGNDEKASAVFADFPYNVKIVGHVSGNGAIKHREFTMASGEMTRAAFTQFLSKSLQLIKARTVEGALIYACMDWRHIGEIEEAGRSTDLDFINMCVWVKSNGGMGSLYRSRHELVFVFRNGSKQHLNNVQLGRFGRNRNNVWNYAGANSFARKNRSKDLALHPTVKPIALVADAILDSTKRNDIVLDPYLGSGTTILAAERTGRRCYAIEIDPLYVDTAIMRWQRFSGKQALHSSGQTFDQMKNIRGMS